MLLVSHLTVNLSLTIASEAMQQVRTFCGWSGSSFSNEIEFYFSLVETAIYLSLKQNPLTPNLVRLPMVDHTDLILC